jgi:hypothetical protein
MRKNMLWMVSLLAITGLSVFMADAQASPSLQESCQSDIQKLCPDTIGAEDKILMCLNKRSKNELTLDCSALVQGPEGSYRACEADIAKFCAGVKPGQGRVLDCLDSHKQKLSKPCRSVVKIAMQNPMGENAKIQ